MAVALICLSLSHPELVEGSAFGGGWHPRETLYPAFLICFIPFKSSCWNLPF
jgi:hypothetical protein